MENSSTASRPVADAKRYARSRITNGATLLPGIDQRSAWVRRCKDTISEYLGDLGGADNTSVAERSIVRRVSVMTVELEMLEARFASKGQATASDLDLYVRSAGNLRRLLEAIGLQRRTKDVTPPDPLQYASEHSP